MDKIERDDFVYALEQTMAFYGKELEKMQASFWVDACGDKSADRLKRALREHVKVGKFAPRPADILSIVDNMSKHSMVENALPPPVTTNCPPEIAQAWMWFIGRIGGDMGASLFGSKPDLDLATEERYLHLVNHEAHKYGTPEAIPDEFKLVEVWG